MKKIISAAALSVLSALLLSGCAPAAAPANPAATVIAPNPEQEASLRAEFRKIDPALGSRGAVDDAVTECRIIMHGAPEEAQIASATRFLKPTKVAPGAPTDEAAKKIVEIIKANGFCKAAA